MRSQYLDECLDRMSPRHHWIEIDPALTPGNRTFTQGWEQSRHHDAGFARSAGSNHRQQTRRWLVWSLFDQRSLHTLHQFLDQRGTPEEIRFVVLRKCLQALVRIPWLLLRDRGQGLQTRDITFIFVDTDHEFVERNGVTHITCI